MKALVIAGSTIILIVVIAAGIIISHRNANTMSDSTSSSISPTFPIATPQPSSGDTSTSSDTTSPQTITLQTSSGAVITVPDFIHAAGTAAEPYSPNEYVLADDCSLNDACTNATPAQGFRIVYDSKNQFFNVLLLAEPLGQSRTQAETLLSNKLGVTSSQLCVLKYSVGTIVSVNETYAGRELGFSSCSGAAKLP